MQALSIMYHDVVEAGAWDASGFAGEAGAIYKLDRRLFDAHLSAIAQTAAGAAIATVDAFRLWTGSRPVFLTFDDGGLSAYTSIAGMLEARGWRGHFFIPTAYIGTPGFLNAIQIRELRRRGHVIGAHSHSHPVRISRLPAAEIGREWQECVARLSDILGERVTTGSVPGGFYSRLVGEMAERAGLEVLFTSEPTTRALVRPRFLVLGRYFVQRNTPAEWSAAVARGRVAPRWRQTAFWKLKKAVKVIGGNAYFRARQALLEARRGRLP